MCVTALFYQWKIIHIAVCRRFGSTQRCLGDFIQTDPISAASVRCRVCVFPSRCRVCVFSSRRCHISCRLIVGARGEAYTEIIKSSRTVFSKRSIVHLKLDRVLQFEHDESSIWVFSVRSMQAQGN